jgi:acyl-CoA thioester hydrolase
MVGSACTGNRTVQGLFQRRLLFSMATHRTDIQMRFGDTDALGHVNNASFAAYAELGRLDFLQVLGTAVRSLILATLYIDFKRQVKFREPVWIETGVERIGTTSVTLGQTVFANGEVAAEIKSVVVHFDYTAHRPQHVTEEMRTALADYVSS